MSCEEHQRMINRFVDHEIKATVCAELFEHLGMCKECRQFYDTLITLEAELDKVHIPVGQPSEEPWRSGRQPIPRIHDRTRIAPRPSTLAFIIVVVLVVGLLFSVNITIERPAQLAPFSATSQ